MELASRVIMGEKIKDMGFKPGLQENAPYVAVKMPVFSFEKIRGAEISLGPEMKSTGECLGIAKTFDAALFKAFLGAGIDLPIHKKMIITVCDEDKKEIIPIASGFKKLGYEIYSTRGTAEVLNGNGVEVIPVNKLEQSAPTVMDLILEHNIDLVINTPSKGSGDKSRDGFLIRRVSIETGVPVLTALDTAAALLRSLENSHKDGLEMIDIAKVEVRGGING